MVEPDNLRSTKIRLNHESGAIRPLRAHHFFFSAYEHPSVSNARSGAPGRGPG